MYLFDWGAAEGGCGGIGGLSRFIEQFRRNSIAKVVVYGFLTHLIYDDIGYFNRYSNWSNQDD